MKKVNITETVPRDANQSLIATRMPFNDFEEILEKIDKADIIRIECGAEQLLIHASDIFRKILGRGSGGLSQRLRIPSFKCF